jgi:peptide subunit release factor 1 (eRF1)
MSQPKSVEITITLSCFDCNTVKSKTVASSEWKVKSFGCKKCNQSVELFTPVLDVGESFTMDFFILANMSLRFYRKT